MSATHALTALRLRSPGEFVASVPSLIGFHPAESLLVVFLNGTSVIVSMRLDLDVDWDDTVGRTLSTASSVDADGVVLAIYCVRGNGDLPLLDAVEAMRKACQEAGLEVRDALMVDSGRFWSYLCQDASCCPPEGQDVPASARLDAERVGAGYPAPAQSREDLVARYRPRPDLAPSWEVFDGASEILGIPLRDCAEQAWSTLQSLAQQSASSGVDDLLRARLILAVVDVRVRDYVLSSMAKTPDTEPLLEALIQTALTAPTEVRDPIAAMAAAASAAFGASTIATRCLLDLSGSQTLGQLVAQMIEVPVPPQQVRQMLADVMPQILEQIEKSTENTTADPAEKVAAEQ